MKYITGLDVFISSVHVDFNSVDDVDQMVPTAQTQGIFQHKISLMN